jgi:hypothetical protein
MLLKLIGHYREMWSKHKFFIAGGVAGQKRHSVGIGKPKRESKLESHKNPTKGKGILSSDGISIQAFKLR